MFKGTTKKVQFQGEEIEIKGLSVYRAIALRGKVKAIGDEVEDNLNMMSEIIAECVVNPVMTQEDVQALDLETFRELFQVVADNNGLNLGNAETPVTTS